jgi:glucoamylase
MSIDGDAFGAPGLSPTWCSSDKDFVTTALGPARLWATVGHGIINEVYWPSTGQPQIRDLGFYLVGSGKWIDLKRVRQYRLATPGPFLPALTVTHFGDDYQLDLEVLPDPRRDVLLVRFTLAGPYRLVAILAPHLASTGRNNSAWIADDAGFAERDGCALCFTANVPWTRLSCGFVGSSDGWQDLNRHGALTYDFGRATNGTVALSGEFEAQSGVIALAFNPSTRGAQTLARSALAENFDLVRAHFLEVWSHWGTALDLPRPDRVLGDAGLFSAMVLKIHEDRCFPGAVVASLSIPWGNTTDTLGGYHLVWPRDATLTAFALLAAQQRSDARHILGHLMAARAADGHWPQNYFPTGEPFWTGVQLDEAALPVMLAAKLRELGDEELPGTRAMVRAATGFVARSGPSSEQDRWEENPGVSAFTLAIAISALVAAAPWLSLEERRYVEALADDWNEQLERWCYVADTALAREVGVAGYYIRIARAGAARSGHVELQNRNGEQIRASALVSLDFSYVVRLGLRSAHDPRVRDSIKVVDHVLRADTPSGGVYHRYNEDGYGEHADGRPFDGTGIGRAWPLLVGERGHLALQSGEDPEPYLRTMWNCASAGGLLPEQVWDVAPIPERNLSPGRPSGSAMPLLWAHAEFLKLLVAREAGQPIELLQSVAERYVDGRVPRAALRHWRDEVPVRHLARGRHVTIEDREPFSLHFGYDGWQAIEDREALAQPFGLWSVELRPEELAPHGYLDFTRRRAAGWEGKDHRIALGVNPPQAADSEPGR